MHKYSPRTSVLAAILLACLAAVPASADEVRLKNGDRYTGKVLTLEKGVLRFDTGHGVLTLAWADVVAATVDMPIVITAADAQPQTVDSLSLVEGQLVLRPGVIVPAAQVVALARPAGPATLTGGANAGFLSTGGNTDVASLRLDGDAIVRADQNRYTASGAVNRVKDRDVETARNVTVTGRYDRFLNERLYANATALFTNDRFRDLDLRSAIGLGLGYQVLDTSRLRFGVEGGYGYVNEHFTVAPDSSYHAIRDNATLDVFIVGTRVVAFHRHDGFFGFTGESNLFVQTRNGLRVGLFGGLVTTLQFDVDYDKSPSPGRKTTDRALGITFGYRF